MSKKEIKDIIKMKPGYVRPMNYALAAVSNMDENCFIEVPCLATEKMILLACNASGLDPLSVKIVYEIMTQAAQED